MILLNLPLSMNLADCLPEDYFSTRNLEEMFYSRSQLKSFYLENRRRKAWDSKTKDQRDSELLEQ